MIQDFEFSYLFKIPEKANQDDKLNKENIFVDNIFSIHTIIPPLFLFDSFISIIVIHVFRRCFFKSKAKRVLTYKSVMLSKFIKSF